MKAVQVLVGAIFLGIALDLGFAKPVHPHIAILCCFMAAIIFAATFPGSHGGRPA